MPGPSTQRRSQRVINRSPLPPRSKPLKRSTTPIRKVNPTAKAKRVVKLRKHYASAEYKAARKAQLEVAEGQCEATHILGRDGNFMAALLPDEPWGDYIADARRCPATTGLQFHETDYGSDLGLIRPIRGVILCKADHQYIEMTRHPTRQRTWA